MSSGKFTMSAPSLLAFAITGTTALTAAIYSMPQVRCQNPGLTQRDRLISPTSTAAHLVLSSGEVPSTHERQLGCCSPERRVRMWPCGCCGAARYQHDDCGKCQHMPWVGRHQRDGWSLQARRRGTREIRAKLTRVKQPATLCCAECCAAMAVLPCTRLAWRARIGARFQNVMIR